MINVLCTYGQDKLPYVGACKKNGSTHKKMMNSMTDIDSSVVHMTHDKPESWFSSVVSSGDMIKVWIYLLRAQLQNACMQRSFSSSAEISFKNQDQNIWPCTLTNKQGRKKCWHQPRQYSVMYWVINVWTSSCSAFEHGYTIIPEKTSVLQPSIAKEGLGARNVLWRDLMRENKAWWIGTQYE